MDKFRPTLRIMEPYGTTLSGRFSPLLEGVFSEKA